VSTAGEDPGGASAFEARRAALHERLAALPSVAVAYSGGVDSTVLLHAAVRALGDRAVAVIADSPSLPRRELAEAREQALQLGARLEIVRTVEGEDPDYQANLGQRCYFCKAALFDAMERVAEREQIPFLAFGEIVDDALDDRPGARAARERGVLAPLAEAGMSKADVRRYATEAGLDVAEKPASACLASRIPVGTKVTPERLATVEAAEEKLRGLGLRVLRVRHHGELARVEVGANELARAMELRSELEERLRSAGFRELELAVYRSPAERSAGA